MSRPRPLPGQRIEFLLSTRDQRERFADVHPSTFAREAKELWGETDVWAAASGRVSDYEVEQWTQIAAEQQDWERRVVDTHVAGHAPDSEVAVALAEEHRTAIERWYFTCPPRLHGEIMEALLDDESFRLRYEGLAPGTAEFLRAAVRGNSCRAVES